MKFDPCSCPASTTLQTGPPKTLVALYATVGQIDWTVARWAGGRGPSGGQPAQSTRPNAERRKAHRARANLLLAGSSSGHFRQRSRIATLVPTANQLNPLDSRASQTLNQTLDGKTAVTVALKELVDHRRVENRSLAARSLALMDEFDPFAALLNDADQRAVWPIEIESLQAALARGPAVAGKIRAHVREGAWQGWRRFVSVAVGL